MFSQRGQGNRHDIETVIEIVPESPGLDLFFERLIGGRNDSDVHANGFAFADPFKLPLLQDCAEASLAVWESCWRFHRGKCCRHVRPQIVRVVLDGPRKRTFDVTE